MNGLQQKSKSIAEDTNSETEVLFIPSRPHWMRVGSLLALTGYIGQMVSQFLVVSGFWLIQSNPSGAMDNPDHRYLYTDEDINTCVNATIASSPKLERPLGATYLLKPKEEEHSAFLDQEGTPYYAALLPACSCVAGTRNISAGMPALPITYCLDKSTQSNELDILVERLLECQDKGSMLACIAQRQQETEGNYEDITAIVEGFRQESDIRSVKAKLQAQRSAAKSQRKDVFDELIRQTLDLSSAFYKIVFPFCRNNSHWYVGEIRGRKKSVNDYAFTIIAHDPYGRGNFQETFPEDVVLIREYLSKRLGIENLQVNSEASPFNQRQREDDGISCGPIMVNDLFKVILGISLDMPESYGYGAIPLRKKQIEIVKTVKGFQPLVGTIAIISPIESAKFLKKNEQWVAQLENPSSKITTKDLPSHQTDSSSSLVSDRTNPSNTTTSSNSSMSSPPNQTALFSTSNRCILDLTEENEENNHDQSDLRREKLLKSITEAIGSDYDWPCHAKAVLYQELSTIRDQRLKQDLDSFRNKINEPEDLLFFRHNEDKTILYSESLSPDHRVFYRINEFIGKIDSLLVHPLISEGAKSSLEKLKDFYNAFCQSLCQANKDKDNAKITDLLSPKVSLQVEGSGFYHLSQKMALHLISKDEYGFTEKKNKTGMRAVQSQNGVHFKFLGSALDPARPGLEYMAYAFATALTSQFLVTPSALLKLDGVKLFDPCGEGDIEKTLSKARREGKNLDETLFKLNLSTEAVKQYFQSKKYTYFVQASQTIGTRDFSKVLEENPKFQGDSSGMGWQFIFSLLTFPGDGKADNYSVDERNNLVIGIDNDKLFYPPLYQQGKSLYTGVNCIFYLLSQIMDKPLDEEVRRAFLKLNPSTVVLEWLGLLHQQNNRYKILRDQVIWSQKQGTSLPTANSPNSSETSSLSERDILNKQFAELGLPISVPVGLAEQTKEHIENLQALLREHPSYSLHKILLEFYPSSVAKYYKFIRQKYPDDPLGAMGVIYRTRDENGNPQTLCQVLELNSDDEAWQQGKKQRVEDDKMQGYSLRLLGKDPNQESLCLNLGELGLYQKGEKIYCLLKDKETPLEIVRFYGESPVGLSDDDIKELKSVLAEKSFLSLKTKNALFEFTGLNGYTLMGKDLTVCVKSFMDYLSRDLSAVGNFGKILPVVIHYFKGNNNYFVNTLFPQVLPKDIWHQIIRTQNDQKKRLIIKEDVFNFLMKRYIEGINYLNSENKTPLDEAFEGFQRTKQSEEIEIITALIKRGAWEMSLSGSLYWELKKKKDSFPDSFWEAFQILEKKNIKLGWFVTLEKSFPIKSFLSESSITFSSIIENSLETLMSSIKKIERIIPTYKKNAVMLLGNSGVGKSSLITYLANPSFVFAEQNVCYDYIIKATQDSPLINITISEGTRSGTSLPVNWEEYWDLPGFNNTLGSLQEIINAFSIYKVIQNSDRVKILLLASEADIRESRRGFLDLINKFEEIFQKNNFDQLLKSLCLVVTKSEKLKIQNVKNKLREIKEEQKNNKTFTLLQKKVLKHLFSDKGKIVFFHTPQQVGDISSNDRTLILDAITQISYLENPQPSFYLSSEAKVFAEHVKDNLDKSISEFISTFFKERIIKYYWYCQNFIKEPSDTILFLGNDFGNFLTSFRGVSPKSKMLKNNLKIFFKITQDYLRDEEFEKELYKKIQQYKFLKLVDPEPWENQIYTDNWYNNISMLLSKIMDAVTKNSLVKFS